VSTVQHKGKCVTVTMCMQVCDVMDQILGILYEKKRMLYTYVWTRPLSLSVCPDLVPAAKAGVAFPLNSV